MKMMSAFINRVGIKWQMEEKCDLEKGSILTGKCFVVNGCWCYLRWNCVQGLL